MLTYVQKRIDLEDLVKKGIKEYEKKMKNVPSVPHEHSTVELAQACLECKGVLKFYCMPKLAEPVSPCAARNLILNMVKIRTSF